eukprot:gene41240-50332_t
MEIPRLLLAIAGKFPGDYVDGRYNESTGNLTNNLGRMPVLEIGDQSVGQSAAINYYLATELGLMGSNTLEAAHIIGIQESVKEMNEAYRKLVPWGTEATPEVLKQWFSEGATDTTGVAVRETQSHRYATWFLGRIENTLDNNGFAVGNKLSLADVLLFFVLGETLDAAQAPDLPQYRREPWGSLERVNELLARHPKVRASVEAVRNHPNVQKWRASRGV